jgi:hypothetical protein
MILEYAQILSTAHLVLDGIPVKEKSTNNRSVTRYKHELSEVLYKATHINHPSTVWARTSKENYEFLYKLFLELGKEYTHRYGKIHLSVSKLSEVLKNPPKNIKPIGFTKMPQAMPDHCKMSDSVEAYRKYYLIEKKNILKYTNRETPKFIKEHQ